MTIRYSDAVQAPSTVVTHTMQEVKPTVTDKKVKNIAKPSTTLKVGENLTLRTENEDTCNSEDFTTFYQSNSSDCK